MKTLPYLSEIIADIKSKKELHALDDDFVRTKIDEFFGDISSHQDKDKVKLKLSTIKSYKQFAKSKEHDFLIKGVRTELRKVYGAFILDEYGKKEKLLARLDIDDVEAHDTLLKLHKSTNERLSHAPELFEKIFTRIEIMDPSMKPPYLIMDLACGLNPLCTVYFREKIKKYYASDISSEDCSFLISYFKKTKLDTEIFPMDLVNRENHAKLAKIPVDICFIFKTLDGLERVERNITEHLLTSIHTRFFAITFPTLSIGGLRKIDVKRRAWLERLFEKLQWTYEKHEIESELLYVVKKG